MSDQPSRIEAFRRDDGHLVIDHSWSMADGQREADRLVVSRHDRFGEAGSLAYIIAVMLPDSERLGSSLAVKK